MKKALFFLMTISVLSCNQNSTKDQTENSETDSKKQNTENFEWLTGKWKRINNEAGKETFENWKKLDSNEYSGIGFTLQKGDTISQEKMDIVKINEQWTLLVKMPNEKTPTKFKISELKNNEFVFVNDSIDFPKKVEYKLEGEKIKAKISNSEMEIPFEFEKI